MTPPKTTTDTPEEVPANVSFASVINTYAKNNGVNVTDAGKAVRANLRRMGDDIVAEKWPQFKTSGKVLRDGNRYPPAIPREFALELVTPRAKRVRDESVIA